MDVLVVRKKVVSQHPKLQIWKDVSPRTDWKKDDELRAKWQLFPDSQEGRVTRALHLRTSITG